MGSKSDGWHVTIEFQKRDTKAWYTAHVYTDSVKVGRDWQHRGFDTKLGEGKNAFLRREEGSKIASARHGREKLDAVCCLGVRRLLLCRLEQTRNSRMYMFGQAG